MRRRKRGIYLADPRKQRLAPEASDGLMWTFSRRVPPRSLQLQCREDLICNLENDYQDDDSYWWASKTRRAKDERASEK